MILFNTEKAIELANSLNVEGEDWDYVVVEVDAERKIARVEVYDEEGIFLSNF